MQPEDGPSSASAPSAPPPAYPNPFPQFVPMSFPTFTPAAPAPPPPVAYAPPAHFYVQQPPAPQPAPAPQPLPAQIRAPNPAEAAAAAVQFNSVRVRQPSTKVYGADFVAQVGSPLAEVSPKAEARAVAAAARKAAKEEARVAAEKEAAAWQLADGVENTFEVGSMLRILQELYSAKHASFAKPFTDADEAKALGIEPTLAAVRAKLSIGGFTAIAPFASSVRDVFASCYLVHGHPERSLLSKKCERLDAIFEQNVTLLPLKQREAASLLAAPTTLLSSATPENGSSSADAAGEGSGRRSARGGAVRQTQAPSTLRLVEMRKQAEAALAEQERARVNREKRELAIKDAEAWAEKEVDPAALDALRASYDGASVCHFISAFVAVLGVPNFVLVEFELALVHFSAGSLLMRYVSASPPRPPLCVCPGDATHVVLS